MENKHISLEDISIRTDLRAGDAGYIIYMHGRIYKEEQNYGRIFEAYVAKTFFDFLLSYDPAKDRVWIAEHEGRIIGCIAIVNRGEKAQLRWVLLEKEYRGIGLGKKLLEQAIAFARDTGYKLLYLETTDDVKRALGMYEKAGFVRVGETPNDTWRENVLELEYEMKL